jgi:hypothetical protein
VILLAVLVSVLGLLAEVGGLKTLQHHERRRLTASIARLEVEAGISGPGDSLLLSEEKSLSQGAVRWQYAALTYNRKRREWQA